MRLVDGDGRSVAGCWEYNVVYRRMRSSRTAKTVRDLLREELEGTIGRCEGHAVKQYPASSSYGATEDCAGSSGTEDLRPRMLRKEDSSKLLLQTDLRACG